MGAGKDKNPPTVPKNGGDWLKTLCSMVTDGDNIWERFVLPLLDIDEVIIQGFKDLVPKSNVTDH